MIVFAYAGLIGAEWTLALVSVGDLAGNVKEIAQEFQPKQLPFATEELPFRGCIFVNFPDVSLCW